MEVPGYALITSASSPLGSACARLFASEGALGVALFDTDSEALSTTKLALEQIAAKKRPEFVVETRVVDVTNERQVEEKVKQIRAIFGKLDYLVNVVEGRDSIGHKFGEMETRTWNSVMDLKVSGTMFVMRAVIKAMLQQEAVGVGPGKKSLQKGSVVNVASMGGTSARSTAWITAQRAIVGLTKVAAEDHGEDGVRVNVVAPGFMEVKTIDQDKVSEAAKQTVPMQRWAYVDEVANAVLFLCGGRASYITGVVLPVDGGLAKG